MDNPDGFFRMAIPVWHFFSSVFLLVGFRVSVLPAYCFGFICLLFRFYLRFSVFCVSFLFFLIFVSVFPVWFFVMEMRGRKCRFVGFMRSARPGKRGSAG